MVLVSAVLITRNAQAYLDACLRSVAGLADEIVVVDAESTDATQAVARRHGARLFVRAPRGVIDEDRHFAVQQALGHWVFIIDADEVIPPALAKQLRHHAETGIVDGVRIHRANFLCGKAIEQGLWNPRRDVQLRLFRKDAVRITDRVHSFFQEVPEKRFVTLSAEPDLLMRHYTKDSVSHLVQGMDRYTTIEAQQRLAAGESPRRLGLLWWVAAMSWRYLRLGGWREGWRGFLLAAVDVLTVVVTQAKLRQLSEIGDASAITKLYEADAEQTLAV